MTHHVFFLSFFENETTGQEDFIKKNEPWCRELELMIKSKKKAEIQSLSAFGFQYLTHTYLPQKLQNGDWV